MSPRLLRLLQIGLRIALPIFVVISIGASTFEYFHPWSVAEMHLPARQDETRLLIGFTRRSTYSGDGVEASGTYIFVPDVFITGATYEITEYDNGAVARRANFGYWPLWVIEFVTLTLLCVIAWRLPTVVVPPKQLPVRPRNK